MKWVTKPNLITWFEEFDLVCSAIFKVPFPTNQIKERESNSLHLNSKKIILLVKCKFEKWRGYSLGVPTEGEDIVVLLPLF